MGGDGTRSGNMADIARLRRKMEKSEVALLCSRRWPSQDTTWRVRRDESPDELLGGSCRSLAPSRGDRGRPSSTHASPSPRKARDGELSMPDLLGSGRPSQR